MLYVTVWLWGQGGSCTTAALFVRLFGPEVPIQRNTQTSTHDRLIHDLWCRGGDVWAEIITVYSFAGLCFTGALFEECPVTWHACAGHIRHEFTDSTQHLPIMTARAGE